MLNHTNMLVRRPMPTKLKPIPQTKKEHFGLAPNMIEANKDSPVPGHNCNTLDQHGVGGPQPDSSVLAICGRDTYRCGSSNTDSLLSATQQLPKNDEEVMEVYPERSITTDDLYPILRNIVTIVVKEVNGILIPTMQRYQCQRGNTFCRQMSTLCHHIEDADAYCVGQQAPLHVASPPMQEKYAGDMEHLSRDQGDSRPPTALWHSSIGSPRSSVRPDCDQTNIDGTDESPDHLGGFISTSRTDFMFNELVDSMLEKNGPTTISCISKPIPVTISTGFTDLENVETTQTVRDLESLNTELAELQICHQAEDLVQSINQNIKMQLDSVDQGDFQTEVDSNMQDEDFLVQRFVETALKKLNVRFRRESSETDNFIKSQGISEPFKLKLKGISTNPVTPVLKKIVAEFGSLHEDAPLRKLLSNPCCPEASMCGARSTEVCSPVAIQMKQEVAPSGGKTDECSSHMENIKFLGHELSSENLESDLSESQIKLWSEKILPNILDKLEKLKSIPEAHTERHFPCEAQDVVNEILQTLEDHWTDISSSGPKAIDHASSSISQTLFKHASESHLYKVNAEIPDLLSTSPLKCSPIHVVSGPELAKFCGSLSKSAGSHLEERSANLKMVKERPPCITSQSCENLGIQSHVNNRDIVQRVAVEGIPLIGQDEAKCDLPEVNPQAVDTSSNNTTAPEMMSLFPDTACSSTTETCHQNHMDLLESTVEKFVLMLMNQCNLPDMLCHSDLGVIGGQSGDLELLNVSDLHISEEKPKMNTKSREGPSPLLGDVLKWNVMMSLQWNNSAQNSTRDRDTSAGKSADEKKYMRSKGVKSEPPWNSKAASLIKKSFLSTAPVKTAVHTKKELLIQATQADRNDGKPSQTAAIGHSETSIWTQRPWEPMESALKLLEPSAKMKTTLMTPEHGNIIISDLSQKQSSETAVNHIVSLTSSSSKTETNASWVSCTDFSEDLVFRILDFITNCRSPGSTSNVTTTLCSTDNPGGLMEVMVELFTCTDMGQDLQKRPKPSLTDLEKAARLVYNKMASNTGLVKTLQDAHMPRRKVVVTELANVVAQLFSEQEFNSTSLPRLNIQANDCTLRPYSDRQLTPVAFNLHSASAIEDQSQMQSQMPPYLVSSKVNYQELSMCYSNTATSSRSAVSATEKLSQMPSLKFTGRKGPKVLSVKIKKHSPRGIHITASERRFRLKEMQRETSTKVSSVEIYSESQGCRNGCFEWILSKLICTEDICLLE